MEFYSILKQKEGKKEEPFWDNRTEICGWRTCLTLHSTLHSSKSPVYVLVGPLNLDSLLRAILILPISAWGNE